MPKCHTTTEKGKKKQNESMISSRILILLLFSNLYCDIIKKITYYNKKEWLDLGQYLRHIFVETVKPF